MQAPVRVVWAAESRPAASSGICCRSVVGYYLSTSCSSRQAPIFMTDHFSSPSPNPDPTPHPTHTTNSTARVVEIDGHRRPGRGVVVLLPGSEEPERQRQQERWCVGFAWHPSSSSASLFDDPQLTHHAIPSSQGSGSRGQGHYGGPRAVTAAAAAGWGWVEGGVGVRCCCCCR